MGANVGHFLNCSGKMKIFHRNKKFDWTQLYGCVIELLLNGYLFVRHCDLYLSEH
jgi:hypothetical protein